MPEQESCSGLLWVHLQPREQQQELGSAPAGIARAQLGLSEQHSHPGQHKHRGKQRAPAKSSSSKRSNPPKGPQKNVLERAEPRWHQEQEGNSLLYNITAGRFTCKSALRNIISIQTDTRISSRARSSPAVLWQVILPANTGKLLLQVYGNCIRTTHVHQSQTCL